VTNEFGIVNVADLPRERFPESGTARRTLTGALRSSEIRVNTVTLGPGEATATTLTRAPGRGLRRTRRGSAPDRGL